MAPEERGTWRLVPLTANDKGQALTTIEVASGSKVTLGRKHDCTRVYKDLSVSGRHCEISVEERDGDSVLELLDLSTNGTFVNEEKVGKSCVKRLLHGDVLDLTRAKSTESTDWHWYRVDFCAEGHSQALEVTKEEELRGDPGSPTVAWGQNASHDMLKAEQESKAKLTSEYLITQNQLTAEKARADKLQREVERLTSQLEEEKHGGQEAKSNVDGLQSRVEELTAENAQLKAERRNYDDSDANTSKDVEVMRLRKEAVTAQTKLEALQKKHEETETDRKRLLNKCEMLDTELSEKKILLERTQARLEKLKKENDETESKLEAATGAAEVAKKAQEAGERKRQELQTQLELAEAAKDEAESKATKALGELEDAVRVRAEAEAMCSSYQKQADAYKSQVDQEQRKAKQAEERLENVGSILRTVQAHCSAGVACVEGRPPPSRVTKDLPPTVQYADTPGVEKSKQQQQVDVVSQPKRKLDSQTAGSARPADQAGSQPGSQPKRARTEGSQPGAPQLEPQVEEEVQGSAFREEFCDLSE
mmetsp:Transcript_798/g.1913  ORF Transcript_798/g.1913 Transcript_798/m.1913 type:complete len:536 (-) Transcript_798:387-1994(-)